MVLRQGALYELLWPKNAATILAYYHMARIHDLLEL